MTVATVDTVLTYRLAWAAHCLWAHHADGDVQVGLHPLPGRRWPARGRAIVGTV